MFKKIQTDGLFDTSAGGIMILLLKNSRKGT
jgi:hypothetical protein